MDDNELLKEILKALNGIWWALMGILTIMLWQIKPLIHW
jgi:hypothetical protein